MDWLGWGSSSEDSAAKPAPSDSRAAASSSEAGGESVLDSVFGAFGWGTSAANATVSEAAKPPTATAATAAAAAPARSGMGLRETPTDLEAVDETEVSVGGQRRSDGDSWLGGLSKAWDTVVHTIAADDAPTRHISHSVHFTEAEQREVTTEPCPVRWRPHDSLAGMSAADRRANQGERRGEAQGGDESRRCAGGQPLTDRSTDNRAAARAVLRRFGSPLTDRTAAMSRGLLRA